jgi:hypothetical protein
MLAGGLDVEKMLPEKVVGRYPQKRFAEVDECKQQLWSWGRDVLSLA